MILKEILYLVKLTSNLDAMKFMDLSIIRPYMRYEYGEKDLRGEAELKM